MTKKQIAALLAVGCLSVSVLALPALARETDETCGIRSGIQGIWETIRARDRKSILRESLYCAVDETLVHVQDVDGELYLFLPASADPEELKLCCALEKGETLYAAGDRLPDGVDAAQGIALADLATPQQGVYTLELNVRYLAENGQKLRTVACETVHVMQSENLSAIYLTSDPDGEGREYVERVKGNEIKGTMRMVTAEGEWVYDGALKQIRARGNSTFSNYPKKAYQIKLNKKTALIEGTKPGKTWVLLASYADAVRLSDQMWKDAAVAAGLPYTARAERVDLYFDGEYCGSYTLSEKNQISANRIDLADMEDAYEAYNEDYGEDPKLLLAQNRFGNSFCYTAGLIDPPQMGGFLLELNGASGDDENWFRTSSGFGINVRSPEYASKDVMLFLSEYFQEFENAIMATDNDGNYTGQNPETGLYYYDYCDLDSLVQQYLINSLSSNRDAFWRSLYFYMDTDGVMYAGPVWDMELTTGVGWNESIPAQQDWSAQNDSNAKWGEALLRIPSFRAALKEAYEGQFRQVLAALLGDAEAQKETGLLSIWERAELGRASVAMDHVLWPEKLRDGSPFALYPNQSSIEYWLSGKTPRFRLWPDETSYDELVQERAQWLQEHKAFLDEYFASMN